MPESRCRGDSIGPISSHTYHILHRNTSHAVRSVFMGRYWDVSAEPPSPYPIRFSSTPNHSASAKTSLFPLCEGTSASPRNTTNAVIPSPYPSMSLIEIHLVRSIAPSLLADTIKPYQWSPRAVVDAVTEALQ